MSRKVTVNTFQERLQNNEPITMLTAYDVLFARLFEQAGVDCILVGDSLGNVVQGEETTIPVTVEDIIYHTRAVVRGTSRVHIVADMPFGSVGVSVEEGVRNGVRLMKEGGAHAVKIEGGAASVPTIEALVAIGVPVMGHLGLTPQSVHAFGGFRVQGRGDEAAERLLADALAVQAAGAYAIVLEMIPAPLAATVSRALTIPTIGIGSGNETAGQVLVGYDMLGLNDGFKPRFLKHFASLAADVRNAAASYCMDVRSRTYPDAEHSFEN